MKSITKKVLLVALALCMKSSMVLATGCCGGGSAKSNGPKKENGKNSCARSCAPCPKKKCPPAACPKRKCEPKCPKKCAPKKCNACPKKACKKRCPSKRSCCPKGNGNGKGPRKVNGRR